MDNLKYPTIDELIAFLQALKTKGAPGTVKVQLVDPDTLWLLKPDFSYDPIDMTVDVMSDYGSRIDR